MSELKSPFLSPETLIEQESPSLSTTELECLIKWAEITTAIQPNQYIEAIGEDKTQFIISHLNYFNHH